MPRLSRGILHKAYNISPLLPLLLRSCRTLPSARNELRWLQEHVIDVGRARQHSYKESQNILYKMCQQRARGVPLQYLLGSQPFGELDIICRKGVLIPRPETEAYTASIAGVIKKDWKSDSQLKILDLCTGTGCIPLLLYQNLASQFSDIKLAGIDISRRAIRLAKENLHSNVRKGHLSPSASSQVSFFARDVFSLSELEDNAELPSTWDVVISNPPYISQSAFFNDTSRSVRIWEPKMALVPPPISPDLFGDTLPQDIFYPAILKMAEKALSKLVLMEVSDTTQALRVAKMALNSGSWQKVEIWRDWPDQTSDHEASRNAVIGEHGVPIKGVGHGRAVVCQR